ncbi:hypothetical protein ACFQ4C_07240 [Larkinella insperata]|uniref:Condensation domain-containing protein n=1 Tax=Larkinella insperata TaxID=332158 RepID=A0ABW3Q860_9BACT
MEFSHILTDGTGGFEFLKTLLLTYFEKSGLPVPDHVSFFRPQQAPAQEEYEDAYSRYFKKLDTSAVNIPRAFHLPFDLKNKPRFEVLLASLPIDALKQKAKEYGVSLTEYLSAVYLFALQQIYHQQSLLTKRLNSNILRIEVPVNLRKLYPTRSMRNFTLYVLPQIDLRLGFYSFDEIVKIVFHQMQLETDKKLINKMIFRNVSGERHPFLRRVPLLIKSLFLSQLYTIGTQQYSGVVTNLGKIDLGAELNKLISHFVFIPPPPNKILKVNCGVAGFGDQLILSFGNITTSRELERQFFTYLTQQAIPVKILDTFQVER